MLVNNHTELETEGCDKTNQALILIPKIKYIMYMNIFTSDAKLKGKHF